MLPRKLTCAFEKSHHAELVMGKTVVIKQENGEIFRINLNPKKWFQDFQPVFFLEFIAISNTLC